MSSVCVCVNGLAYQTCIRCKRWTSKAKQFEVHKEFIIVLTVKSTYIHERTCGKLTLQHIKTHNEWANEKKSEIDWHAITQGNAHAEINILICCALLRFTFRCAKWLDVWKIRCHVHSFLHSFPSLCCLCESNVKRLNHVEVASHVIWVWTFRFRRKRAEKCNRWCSNVIFEVEHYCFPTPTHPPTFRTSSSAGF